MGDHHAPETSEPRDDGRTEGSANGLSRRTFLVATGAAALAAAACEAPGRGQAVPAATTTSSTSTTTAPSPSAIHDPFSQSSPPRSTASTTSTTSTTLPPPPPTGDRARHAVARVTFGATAALVDEVDRIGVGPFIEQQLDPGAIDDTAVDDLVTGYRTLGMTNAELKVAYNADGGYDLVVHERHHATVLRAVFSKRQLYELMVDFWNNHFNVNIYDDKAGATYTKTVDDRGVIRRHAMGRFVDLLLASAQSPAMLVYLDNWLSRGSNPNQNYARELMELHTLGVDGGYTEADVDAVSRILTGWGIDGTTNYVFTFFPTRHHNQPVTALGQSYPGTNGMQDGIDLLNRLARHPSAARFLATKLCRRFVGDRPPSTLVDSAASVYLANDTAIVPVLRHILTSSAFFDSEGTKLRRPLELVAAALRVTGASVDPAPLGPAGRAIRGWLRNLAQEPFAWPPPNGYPDVAGAWTSTNALLQRWSFPGAVMSNGVGGVSVNARALLPTPTPATAGALVAALGDRLLQRALDSPTTNALLGFLGVGSSAPVTETMLNTKLAPLVGLVLCTPPFEYR